MIAYTYNKAARQYVGPSGRFVPRADVRSALDAVIDAAQAELRATALRLQSGEIAINDWFGESLRQIKRIIVASGTLAVGGPHGLTPSILGRLGADAKRQFAYLASFARELENGLPPDGRFLARIASYGDAGRATYEAITRKADIAAGMRWERRVLGSGDRACKACRAEAAKGWRPAGELAAIGSLTCLNSCHCSFERSKARPSGVAAMSSDGLLDHLPGPLLDAIRSIVAFARGAAKPAKAKAAKPDGEKSGGSSGRKKLTGGNWVTINGHPVYIKGGKIVAGGIPGVTHDGDGNAKGAAAKVARKDIRETRAKVEGKIKEERAASRAKAKAAAKANTKPTGDAKPAKAEKAEKAKAEKAASEKPATRSSRAAKAEKASARVAASAREASALKSGDAGDRLKDIASRARSGSLDAADAHKQIDRIARGAKKDELFAAAERAGIEHGAKTKKDLVAHLKAHAEGKASGAGEGAGAAKPAKAAKAGEAKPAKSDPPAKLAKSAARPSASPDPDASKVASRPDPSAKAAFDAHRKYIDAEHDAAIARLAKDVGMTPDAYRKAVGGKLKDVIDEGEFYVRADPKALGSILSDGRFKNQHETGTTNGSLDPSGRRKVEADMFGVGEDRDAASRPVYGYVSTPDFHSVGNSSQQHVAQYGGAVVRLKPGVRDRATITLGDSLARHDMVHSSPATAPDLRMAPVQRPAWEGVHKLLLDGVGSKYQVNEGLAANFGYIEAQYHGGLKVSDIRDVAFERKPPRSLAKALDAKGIPWRVIEMP